MLYHPRLNVLLLCGDGGSVSGWRLLDGFPHWAPTLGQSVEKVGRQGTAAYNIVDCMCLCGFGTIVVQGVAEISWGQLFSLEIANQVVLRCKLP